MSVTLECPECGSKVQSKDGAPTTCPDCEGSLVPVPQKKRPADRDSTGARTSAKKKAPCDDEDRPKKKAGRRSDDEELPKKRAKPRDEEDNESENGSGRNGAIAKSLGIDPGFKNKALMKQVEDELSEGEVLYWAGRMCPEIANRWGRLFQILGAVIAIMFLVPAPIVLLVMPGFLKLLVVVPVAFSGIGVAVAVFLPRFYAKHSQRCWYAVTNERAIVYIASVWGKGGKTETYEPDDLDQMKARPSKSVDGAGNLVFKVSYDIVTRGNHTSKHEVPHGFLGIKDLWEVETLVRKVLLGDED
jgi:hypothetical protein